MYLKDVDFNILVPSADNLIKQIPDTSLEVVYERALSNLPEIKAAQSNIRTTLYAQRVARGAYYPTVTFSAGVTTGYSSARTKTILKQTGQPSPNVYIRDTTGTVYTIKGSLLGSSGFATVSEKYPFSNQFKDNINKNINIQATIPILNRLTTKNNIDIARLNYLKTNNELSRVKQNIYNNLAVALTDYKNSRRNYLAYQRQVASLEALNKSAETKRQLGVGSAYDVLTSSNLLNAAVANKIQQEYDVIYRKLLLDFFAGVPLSLQ
jgi:outer membrane protein